MVDRGGTTRRFARVLAGVALAVAISGCAGASPSATATGGSSASAGATATPPQTSSPSSTPLELGAGSWTVVEGMTERGSGYTATLLLDGRVLLAGGVIGVTTDDDWASAELFDPIDGSWTRTGDMLQGRAAHTATLLPSGLVLVAGGYAMNNNPTSAELYDPETGRWTAAGNMIEARSDHTATLLSDGTVLVAGGGLASTVLVAGGGIASTELFDPVRGTWMATGAMAEARLGPRATLLPDGTVLVAGGEISCGFECHTPLASAELYDPASATWSSAGTMTEARWRPTATLLPDGTVLVVGGCCGGGYLEPLGSAELFDPGRGTWTATRPMIEAGSTTATRLVDGKVLVAGDGPGPHAWADLYDPASGTWAATGKITAAYAGETATLLADGRVLLVAPTSGYETVSAQLYDPKG